MIEHDEDINQQRAGFGLDAVLAAAEQTGVDRCDSAETAITDVLAYIAHACNLFGLDPEETFASGLDSYFGDAEDGPRVKQRYDGQKPLVDARDPAPGRGKEMAHGTN